MIKRGKGVLALRTVILGPKYVDDIQVQKGRKSGKEEEVSFTA